jgi:hypothetical protein
MQALGVDYRILIRTSGFDEILIKTLLASGIIFGRICFLLRATEFYQNSAGFLKFLIGFCYFERVVCDGACRLMRAVAHFLPNTIQNSRVRVP